MGSGKGEHREEEKEEEKEEDERKKVVERKKRRKRKTERGERKVNLFSSSNERQDICLSITGPFFQGYPFLSFPILKAAGLRVCPVRTSHPSRH